MGHSHVWVTGINHGYGSNVEVTYIKYVHSKGYIQVLVISRYRLISLYGSVTGIDH